MLQISGDKVQEIVSPKFMKSNLLELPMDKHEVLDSIESLLDFSEDDWRHLAAIFSRADAAWCVFNYDGISVGLKKSACMLEVDLSSKIGPIMRLGSYSFFFGEFADPFVVNGSDDRYTFVEKLGKMFVFRPQDWNFMLNFLSKVDGCVLTFFIGTAKVVFDKHPYKDGLELRVGFVDERDTEYVHNYSQKDLSKLTEGINRNTQK